MIQVYKNVQSAGTELSRIGNRFLGDKTGRTITRTTMDGVYRITNGKFMPSGELTHATMIGTGIALRSKNKVVKAVGYISLATLIVSYFAGR